jgi:drug/metabolite transporter (DMT)-like permease
VLSIVFAAVPFAFATIRAISTRHDVRYVWVALGSLLGGVIGMLLVRAAGRSQRLLVATAAASFAGATLFAMAAALLLGTRLGPGMLVVASSFALCTAASCLLQVLGRRA